MTDTVCNEYKPDVVAQGDCINCGNGFEFHQKPKFTQIFGRLTRPMKGCEIPKICDHGIPKNVPCGMCRDEVDKNFQNHDKPRKQQVKLTVTVNDRSGGIIPQVILIPGETQMHQLDEAVRKAVIEQTVHDGTAIMKVTYTP